MLQLSEFDLVFASCSFIVALRLREGRGAALVANQIFCTVYERTRDILTIGKRKGMNSIYWFLQLLYKTVWVPTVPTRPFGSGVDFKGYLTPKCKNKTA